MSDDADSGKWWKAKAQMPRNQKVCGLSDAAFRLHVSVSCWCCEEVNDGKFKAHVPAAMPRAPRGKKLTDAIREIVLAELWHATPEGYEINDFLKYNMSRSQWEARKAAGKLGGERSGESRRSKSEAPASAPARQNPKQRVSGRQPSPEHDHDHDRSNKDAAAKDSEASARALAAENQAAAAAGVLELKPGERARLLLQSPALAPTWQPERWPELLNFAAAAGSTWRTIRFGAFEYDPLVRLLLNELAADVDPLVLANAGRHLGIWLSEDGPEGSRRSLNMVTFQVLRRALDDAQEATRLEEATEERVRLAKADVAQRRAAAGGNS